jgi:hypothetical protein
MSKPETCPLRWEFDQCGRWTAYSQIIDPDMTDEDPDAWCREWCLQWTIYVDEQGRFCVDESDKLLWRECDVSRVLGIGNNDGAILRALNKDLELIQSRIARIEDHFRTLPAFSSGKKIKLLPAEIYNR